MYWSEIRIVTEHRGIECVANILSELGAGGVVIEDPQLISFYAQSGQWDAYEFSDLNQNNDWVIVKGYFPQDQFLSDKIDNLHNELTRLKTRIADLPVQMEIEEVREEDWAHSWKKYYKPIKIGHRIVIKPTWEVYQAQRGELVIELDPGMAFGTGGHVTTTLCLQFLEKYIQKGMGVIDLGAGSGILSIAAAKLGAERVQALDFDTVAVKVALDNIQNNGLENKITVKHSDLFQKARAKVHLIVANIVADIINKLVPQAGDYLFDQGVLIVSGIISDRQEDVLHCLKENNFKIIEIEEDDGWVAIVAILDRS